MHNIRWTEDGWGGLLCTHTQHETKISSEVKTTEHSLCEKFIQAEDLQIAAT